MLNQFLNSIEINYNYWILQSIAMLITCFAIRGLRLTNPFGVVLAVLGLGFVNSVIWDAALFFKIPEHISLQAAVVLLANGLIFWTVVKILPGIEIRGVLPALLAPLIFTVTSILIEKWGHGLDFLEYGRSIIYWIGGVRNQLLSNSGGDGIGTFSP